MKEAFRESLIRHMDETGTTAARLSRETGVPKGLIDKLRQRKVISPNVADAIRLARYFGKSTEEMIGMRPNDAIDALMSKVAGLSPEQIRFLDILIDTLRATRLSQPSKDE